MVAAVSGMGWERREGEDGMKVEEERADRGDEGGIDEQEREITNVAAPGGEERWRSGKAQKDSMDLRTEYG